MLDRDSILRKLDKIDDKLFTARVLDRVLRAEKTKDAVFTDFLDPYQLKLVEKALTGVNDINYTINGGCSGAERVIAIFGPNFMSDEELQSVQPFSVISIKPVSRENLTHRDYLGALMGLGIKREKIGDIIARADSCDVIVIEEIADYIKYNLWKVGNARVDVEIKDLSQVRTHQPKVKEINATVASLRLDVVASPGFGMSRSKMTEFIKAGKVSLNWEATDNATKQVKAGDNISMRGRGRVVVESIGGTTKKGRISIALKKYI